MLRMSQEAVYRRTYSRSCRDATRPGWKGMCPALLFPVIGVNRWSECLRRVNCFPICAEKVMPRYTPTRLRVEAMAPAEYVLGRVPTRKKSVNHRWGMFCPSSRATRFSGVVGYVPCHSPALCRLNLPAHAGIVCVVRQSRCKVYVRTEDGRPKRQVERAVSPHRR